jgi:hypothetical protein
MPTVVFGSLIELRDTAAKKSSGRSIPMHPDLAAALAAWRQVASPSNYVVGSQRGGVMTPLSIVAWFNRAFRNIGLKGCSSHSGPMSNCSPVTGRFRPPSGTSTATPSGSVLQKPTAHESEKK